MMIRRRSVGYWALLFGVVLMASWDGSSAAGQEEAPRHPPEPFRVFVHTGAPAEPALRAKLEEALPIVRERVRQRNWFRLAKSPETANITFRIVNYRTGQYRNSLRQWVHGVTLHGREFHFVDAVVQGGGVRARLSGLDERSVGNGPSLRSAASHLAEELERFCKDNYAALSQLWD